MGQDSNEEKICDICGDIGVADAIIKCTHCENCMHRYCMLIEIEEHVEEWVCEECEARNRLKQQNSQLGQGSKPKFQRVGSANWEKRVETGKTRYLPVEEALMLSSGEKKSSPVKFELCSKLKSPKISMNVFERPPIKRKIVPLDFSSQCDLASRPLVQPKRQRLGNMTTCGKQQQQSTELAVLPKSMSALQPSGPSQAHKNRDVQYELRIEIKWAQTKTRRLMKKPSCSPWLKQTTSGVNGHTSNEPRISNAEVLHDLENCSFAPALEVLWKGSFNIEDDHCRAQIQAQPPSHVLRKIYNLSMKMPDLLHFQLISAETSWVNLFNEVNPDERDIALYFLPSVEERLTEYLSLLESISQRDLALKVQIDDIELFVFPSKRLPLKIQCLDGHYFLWGVFRPLARDTTACLGNPALQSSHSAHNEVDDREEVDNDPALQSSHNAHNEVDDREEVDNNPALQSSHKAHNEVDDREEVDMDVDMIGGVIVGRVDVPVDSKSLGLGGIGKRESNGAVPVPAKFTREQYDLFPPGFEDVYESRIQGSSASKPKMVADEDDLLPPGFEEEYLRRFRTSV